MKLLLHKKQVNLSTICLDNKDLLDKTIIALSHKDLPNLFGPIWTTRRRWPLYVDWS